ncbi:hypothetical protein Leryth_021715 [Lithospermum erythrorhizon]|nr:hypothetical protein Leryth_021715 [Lithospermum erythrorhizon]
MQFMETSIFLLFASAFFLVVNSSEPPFNDDVLGLVVLKSGLIDPQKSLSSWNEDDISPCNWVGVKCDHISNRVSELNLDNFSLSGHIGRSILRLQFLEVVSISNNNFSGEINSVFGGFGSLRVLDLSNNGFFGEIPDEIFRQCRVLREISVAGNDLSGVIPYSITSCASLVKVNVSFNRLSGGLPYGIGGLSGLESVDLSGNLFEGEIPRGLESLYNLEYVDFSGNNFSGWLPENIGNCLMLKYVDFSNNGLFGYLPKSLQKLGSCSSLRLRGNLFSGELPDWIGDLKSLTTLDLSMNSFSGQVPDSFGKLQLLNELNLSNNQFVGSLPGSLASCYNLMELDVSKNHLTGNFPSWIFELAVKSISLSGNKFVGKIEYPPLTSMAASFQNLRFLDLSSNALSGEIGYVVGNLSKLEYLNMSKNYFEGPVPTSISQLNSTLVLDLSDNRLNGTIPFEIGRAASVMDLRLAHNFFTGEIPLDIQNCSYLTNLDLSWNNLTGPIPSGFADLTYLQNVDLSFNHFTGSLPRVFTNLSHLIVFNVSHNNLEGELPVGGFFNTIPLSSVTGNPSLCGSVVNQSCPAVHPKPIVLNPNAPDSGNSALSSNTRHNRIILSISSLVAIGAAVFIALGVVIVTILNMHARASMMNAAAALAFSGGDDYSPSHGTEANYGKLVMFSGSTDFAAGTQALLNKDCELGRGGFGAVYRAELQDGRFVAIKKLNVSCLIKGEEDFGKEVKTLGSIKHPNLVKLEGYYWTSSLQLLISEYVSGGSLYSHLHERQFETCLSWQHRFNIILEIAKGLAHLHRLKIIHYNMKSSNILIDCSGEAKVGDFGLARLLPTLDRYILSSKIQSAMGYMAPEFACQTVKITEKCDVYGFGVLTLEIVTGKKPVEYMEDDVMVLCDMVRGALEKGRAEECVDSKLIGNFVVEEVIPVIKLGLICASQVPSTRPDMEEVIRILELIHNPSEVQEELE